MREPACARLGFRSLMYTLLLVHLLHIWAFFPARDRVRRSYYVARAPRQDCGCTTISPLFVSVCLFVFVSAFISTAVETRSQSRDCLTAENVCVHRASG